MARSQSSSCRDQESTPLPDRRRFFRAISYTRISPAIRHTLSAPPSHEIRFTSHVSPFTVPARSTARFVALLAVQGLSKMLFPAFLCQDPGPIRHRRLVTHMLTMAALEVGHPIAIFIQMITNNWLLHAQASLTSASNERG